MNTPIKTISHTAANNAYDIKVFSDGNGGYVVAGYIGNRQVTAGYSVTMNVDYDFHTYHGTWAHDHLINAVKDDLDEGRVAK